MKHYGKLTAAAAAGFMALSAMGVAPIFAEEESTPGVVDGSTIDINQTLTLADGVKPATAVEFVYTVTPSTGLDSPAAGLPADTVFNGVQGGLTSTGSKQGTVEDNVMSFTNGGLHAHASKFPYPGIYQYEVTQTPLDAENNAYEDISRDNNSYVVKVYVGYNDAGALEVTNLEVSQDGSKTDDLSFANIYDPAALTITKQFAGNQAISTDTFTFNVAINGQAGEEYIIKHGDTSTTVTAGANGEASTTISGVGKNDSFRILGLSDSDSYTITEDANTLKGYTSSWTNNTTTGTIADNTDAVVTNTKNGAVPTGILMTAAPYAGLVGLGGIFAGLFFRRKRED